MGKKFIRGIWGVESCFYEAHKDESFEFLNKFTFDKKHCCSTRRFGLNGSIEKNVNKIDKDKCVCYVYGEENFNYFNRFGIKTVLVHKEPYKYHPIDENWKHKLEIIKLAAEENEEIVWLDWDCEQRKSLPNNFWEILNQKESFQACLVKYAHKQIDFRPDRWSNKVLPNGGFVYIRDRSIPEKLLGIYDKFKTWTDESPYARYTDEMMGGFDREKYFKLFEPLVAKTRRSIYEDKQEACFYHR